MDVAEIADKLIPEAIRSLANSHPSNPEKLRFGSALLTKSDRIFVSSAFWSDTLTLAVHAEHAALIHAASHGEREIVAIACVSTEDLSGDVICHPCGICKQLIYESYLSSKIDVQVIMANLNGDFESRKISELVQFPWPADRNVSSP